MAFRFGSMANVYPGYLQGGQQQQQLDEQERQAAGAKLFDDYIRQVSGDKKDLQRYDIPGAQAYGGGPGGMPARQSGIPQQPGQPQAQPTFASFPYTSQPQPQMPPSGQPTFAQQGGGPQYGPPMPGQPTFGMQPAGQPTFASQPMAQPQPQQMGVAPIPTPQARPAGMPPGAGAESWMPSQPMPQPQPQQLGVAPIPTPQARPPGMSAGAPIPTPQARPPGMPPGAGAESFTPPQYGPPQPGPGVSSVSKPPWMAGLPSTPGYAMSPETPPAASPGGGAKPVPSQQPRGPAGAPPRSAPKKPPAGRSASPGPAGGPQARPSGPPGSPQGPRSWFELAIDIARRNPNAAPGAIEAAVQRALPMMKEASGAEAHMLQAQLKQEQLQQQLQIAQMRGDNAMSMMLMREMYALDRQNRGFEHTDERDAMKHRYRMEELAARPSATYFKASASNQAIHSLSDQINSARDDIEEATAANQRVTGVVGKWERIKEWWNENDAPRATQFESKIRLIQAQLTDVLNQHGHRLAKDERAQLDTMVRSLSTFTNPQQAIASLNWIDSVLQSRLVDIPGQAPEERTAAPLSGGTATAPPARGRGGGGGAPKREAPPAQAMEILQHGGAYNLDDGSAWVMGPSGPEHIPAEVMRGK